MSDTLVAPRAPSAEDRKQPGKEKKRRGAFWLWLGLLLIFTVIGGLFYVFYAGTPGPRYAAKLKVENAFFFRIDGKDKQGHSAAFDFIILTKDYTWAKGSASEVVSNGTVIPEAGAAERVLTPNVRTSLASASDLIAVGLASSEGERAQEEARALARARTVLGWLTKVSKPEMALWTLTLGQYDERACSQKQDADSSFERPVILAGVRSKAAGANLQEALADAVSGHDNLPSRECYSRFDMEKIR